jgi:hypothetical protein
MAKRGFISVISALGLSTLVVSSCLPRPVPASKQTQAVLSLCEIADHWQQHHLQTEKILGTLTVGFESSVLRDSTCPDYRVWVHFPTTIEPPVIGDTKKLSRLLRNRDHVTVILEGVFHGPAPPTNVDPRLPATIRDALERSPQRYGHLGAYDYMLTLKKILDMSAVPRAKKLNER